MAELVGEGLVRAIGLSNYSLEEVEICHAQRRVDVVQVGLSLIDYLDDRPYIARCGELGIAATIYEPVAGGVLSGKTLDEARAAWPGPWRVLNQPGVTAAIAGSRDGSHMEENAGAAALDVSAVMDEIEELVPRGPTFGVAPAT